MNVKKIIKGIIGLGAMGGVAYAAYKLGEKNGEVNERFRQKYDEDDDFPDFDYDDDDDDEELDNYYGSCFEKNNDKVQKYNYVEPDDGCIAPNEDKKPKFTVGIYDFAPLSSIKVDGVSDDDMDMLVYHISLGKYTSNKQIRDVLEVDKDTAAKVIYALRKAGYIGKEYSNYIIPVYITTEVYFRLRGELD